MEILYKTKSALNDDALHMGLVAKIFRSLMTFPPLCFLVWGTSSNDPDPPLLSAVGVVQLYRKKVSQIDSK